MPSNHRVTYQETGKFFILWKEIFCAPERNKEVLKSLSLSAPQSSQSSPCPSPVMKVSGQMLPEPDRWMVAGGRELDLNGCCNQKQGTSPQLCMSWNLRSRLDEIWLKRCQPEVIISKNQMLLIPKQDTMKSLEFRCHREKIGIGKLAHP